MRRRYIFDKDLDCMIEITSGSNFAVEKPSGLQIIRDIEPYRTAASDVASDNKRVVIGSRSRHRTFLSDNRYVEVGNEAPISGERPRSTGVLDDLRRALGDYGSNRGER